MLPRLSLLVSTVTFSDFPDFSVSDMLARFLRWEQVTGDCEWGRKGSVRSARERPGRVLGKKHPVLIPSYPRQDTVCFRVNGGGAGDLVIIHARTEAGKTAWLPTLRWGLRYGTGALLYPVRVSMRILRIVLVATHAAFPHSGREEKVVGSSDNQTVTSGLRHQVVRRSVEDSRATA